MNMLPDNYLERRLRRLNLQTRFHTAIMPGDSIEDVVSALHSVLGEFLNMLAKSSIQVEEEEQLSEKARAKLRPFLKQPDVWNQPGAVEIWDAFDLDDDEDENPLRAGDW